MLEQLSAFKNLYFEGFIKLIVDKKYMNFLEITSLDNEKIKFLKKLNLKKYRDDASQFFLENLTIILDAAKSGILPQSLFITQECLKKNEDKLTPLLNSLPEGSCFLISPKIEKIFSNLDTPSGVAVVYGKTESELDFTEPVIYLNAISDPGNLGTILRSALAFNLTNIVLDEFCADLYNYKTVASAKDAIFKMRLKFDKNLTLLKELKQTRPILATSLAGAKDIKEIKQHDLFCLVLGNEANGVSPEILSLADGFLKIPLPGNIESLNVSAAAAIIFYLVRN